MKGVDCQKESDGAISSVSITVYFDVNFHDFFEVAEYKTYENLLTVQDITI